MTVIKLARVIPPERRDLIDRMGRILESQGFCADAHDIETAWLAACLSLQNRPSFEMGKFIDDDKLFTMLRAQLVERPGDVEQIEFINCTAHDFQEEDPDEDASTEQDDGAAGEGEAGGEPAELQSAPELPRPVQSVADLRAAKAKGGRPKGSRNKESL